MEIYLRDFKKPRSIKEFLYRFFMTQANISKQNCSRCLETYYDKNCTSQQCSLGRLRSYDDLFDLVKTYYPTITDKRLFRLLLTTNYRTVNKAYNSNELCIIEPQLYHCSSMRRIRICYTLYPDKRTIENMKYLLNYNYIIQLTKYDSKYDWVQLFAILGINSNEDLKEYYEKHRKIYEPRAKKRK